MKSINSPQLSMTIGTKLKKARVAKQLSQAQVSRILGYSNPQFVSNFERGTCTPPIDKIKVLIKLYNLSAEDMIELILSEQERLLRKKFSAPKSKRKSV